MNNLFGQAWLSGTYPIPDSMRDGWGSNAPQPRPPPDGDSDNGSIDENANESSGTEETKMV